MKVQTGDRVEILAGDERGGWGVVSVIRGGNYHVRPYGGTDERIYERSEIRKKRS